MTENKIPEWMDLETLGWAISHTEEEVLGAVDSGDLPKPEKHLKGKPMWRWSQVDRMMMDRDTRSVYFIEMGDFIKIGYSANVGQRIEDIGHGVPLPVRLLHEMPGTFDHETDLHRRFAHLCTRGEWYQKCPELLEYIEGLKRKASR